jgi:DNA repair protein RadA/Sms
MAKAQKAQFICTQCGSVAPRWQGKCESCNAWNSIVEERVEVVPKGLGAVSKNSGSVIQFEDLKSESPELPRSVSGMGEFDRVTGGGLVPGSVTLIGGDPGIGKSTLLLQLTCILANRNVTCAYISGEESVDQVRLRAKRMGLADSPVDLASATNVRDIIKSMTSTNNKRAYDVMVIDSIQTMYVDTVDSAPGTVTQVRTSCQELIRAAKRLGVTLLVVGHVTKEGAIAGPRVLEHMVDTVLYFEGDRGHQFRILRGVKNRFGPTDEIGVFEMASQGLVEVENPSALFLSERSDTVPGSAVLAGLEGSRPVLVEIQALVAPTAYATPRRAVVGWDSNRLAMLLAVLESRCGVMMSGQDVYLNVSGGLRITEPAADLAVAVALISALSGDPVPKDTVIFGEIGLAGEIRHVPQPDLRMKEASKLGFQSAFIPKPIKSKNRDNGKPDLNAQSFERLEQVARLFKKTPSKTEWDD